MAGDRLISTLVIPRALKTALTDAGYRKVSEIASSSPTDLTTELGISLEQALELVQAINGPQGPDDAVNPTLTQIRATTAADLLSPANLPRFTTQSVSLDTLISKFSFPAGPSSPGHSQTLASPTRKGKEKDRTGAIHPGMTLEISGPPGGGKTSVALGIALGARCSGALSEDDDSSAGNASGRESEVLLIDTEGGITAERIHAAAELLCRSNARRTSDVLQGIHIVRVHTQVQMLGLMHTLDEWLEAHRKVALVVIDTLSFHFRQPGLDMGARRRVMELIKQKIGQATTVFGCAVVVCNQLATKLLTAENKPANFDTGDRAILMPQLGDAWTTSKTIRLALFRGGEGDELRYAHASMSGSSRDELPWACFDIDSHGLPCDVPETLYKPLA
ncbi:hypothetical protein IAU60_003971 [Kwoniella sp. DSM 27419]